MGRWATPSSSAILLAWSDFTFVSANWNRLWERTDCARVVRAGDQDEIESNAPNGEGMLRVCAGDSVKNRLF